MEERSFLDWLNTLAGFGIGFFVLRGAWRWFREKTTR